MRCWPSAASSTDAWAGRIRFRRSASGASRSTLRSTAVYETNRRSVYLMTQRLKRHPFLALFDGADTNASTPTRVATTVPTQALFLMNDPFVHEQAGALAARLLQRQSDEPGERIAWPTRWRWAGRRPPRNSAEWRSSSKRIASG